MKKIQILLLLILSLMFFNCQNTDLEEAISSEYSAKSKEINFNNNKKNSSYYPNRLNWNEYINVGGFIQSSNNLYRLILQSDGNLVLYKGNFSPGPVPVWYQTALWATNTNVSGWNTGALIMQSDGNLVLYLNSSAVWATNTNQTNNYNHKGWYVILQDDGNLVVYDRYGFNYPLWDRY